MNRAVKRIITLLVWAGIVAYLLCASHLDARKRADTYVRDLHITVRDSSDTRIIRAEDVRRWIVSAGLSPEGQLFDSVDLMAITRTVAAHDFVQHVKTSVGLDSVVNVTVRQRIPALRVIGGGYNFYYTTDGYIVPANRRSAYYVPVVTGQFDLPFRPSYSGPLREPTDSTSKKAQESYRFFHKLINFVNYIEDDNFWNSQIVQINVTGRPEPHTEPEVELIPRVGDQVIMLGWLDGYERKLDKLMKFYRKALPHEGWETWSYIDLRYDGQVVCSRR